MIIKDRYGTVITIYQARSGKIVIPVGNSVITLSKEEAESFPLYDIDDFDVELYQKAYNTDFNITTAST